MLSETERFAFFCSKPTESGCIEWRGGLDPNGYGAFKYRGKKTGAHRAALMIAGVEIPAGMDVCHTCDNRKCVNVDHLFIGSRSENMQDALSKGRLPLTPGAWPYSKIRDMTDSQLIEAYRSQGSIKRAAKFVHVSKEKLVARLRQARAF